jgi:hypothetical protein
MEAQGELWAEEKFDPKPLVVTPVIAWSSEVVTQGHI